jgi:hypothetical protein
MKKMGIKGFWTILFLLKSGACFAQQIRGTIIEAESKMPIPLANISNEKQSTLSDLNGNFQLPATPNSDSLWISKPGYRTRYVIASQQLTNGKLLVYLAREAVSLREVQIKAKERYKQDSLRIRKEFSNVFSYKPLGIKDAFIARSPENRVGRFRDPNSNSTASIVSMEVLQFAGMLLRPKSPLSKLQKTMLQEEQNKSVEQSFSKNRISALTPLHGDSLIMFMDQYRPSPAENRRMTSYELMLYIKRSYKDFLKPGGKREPLPALKLLNPAGN